MNAPIHRYGDEQIYQALKRHGWRRIDAAVELRINCGSLRKLIPAMKAKGYKIPRDPKCYLPEKFQVDPTQDEIRAVCEEYQATWKPHEEARRRGVIDWDSPAYSVPEAHDPTDGDFEWDEDKLD